MPRRQQGNYAGVRHSPLRPWQDVRPADCFSCASWQDITWCRELGGGDPGNFSEDCLYLNVWAPAVRHEPLPVMVWLHGGGYTIGAGSLPPYDGYALAKRGAIVVTVNYRLGHLAFSPTRRWKAKRRNVSIISLYSIKSLRCAGYRIILPRLAAIRKM
ncbi:esterase [Salmonella bongori]|nr:esterase [Salmonella bongori]